MIADDDGNEVPRGETGEIVARGTQEGLGFLGYFRNEQTSRDTQREGWLLTGDLGRMDEDGYIFYAGRKKEMLRRRGINISAWEVETALAAHPDIAEIAVTGVPSRIGDHDILCHVLLREGVDYDPAALAAWSRENLPRPHVPRYWKRVERFERTPSQRIRKGLLDRDITRAFHLGDR